MQDSSGHELVVKLSSLLRLHGDLILKGQSKLCLTATSLEFLNQCFGHLRSERPSSQLSGVTDLVPNDVTFLLDFVGKTPSLKLVQGTCLTFDGLVNISCFRALQVLEIKKVPTHLIRGFQSLQPQLKTFICNRSLNSLNDLLVQCGGDHLSAPFAWPRLEYGDFSYNGIEQLDDSLELLPALRTLNLSHNKIKCTDNEPYWQYLSGVQHVNIGFNQLDCIPVIPVGVGIIAFQMTTLIIRNNNLQNLKGLQAFSNLHTLDASFNCIMSFSELTPLAQLHNLTLLYLQGNPVVFYPDYRIITTTCLYPVPRREAIKIDGKPLDPVEEIYLGRNVHPVSLLSYIRQHSLPHPRLRQVREVEELNESNSSESQDSPSPRSSPRRRKKRKNKKGRRQVAREIDFDDDDETTSAEDMTVTSTPVENILEFADDVEQLKKLREMGGEAWLPAIDTMVHNDEPAPSSSECPPGQGSSVFRTESLQSFSDDRLEINSRASSLSVITLVDEDVTDEQHFLVTLVQTEGDEERSAVPLLVTIKDDFIVEKNYIGKVICQLETCRVKDVQVDWTDDSMHPVTHVMFDYMSRDRQARHYMMENHESALQLAEFLKPFVTAHAQAIMTSVEHLQCLKCSAEFSRPQKSDDQICPDCGSTMTVLMPPDQSKPAFSVNETDSGLHDPQLASALNNCSIKTIDSEMSVAVLASFSSLSSPSADAVNHSANKQSALDPSDNDVAFKQDKVRVQDEAVIRQGPDVIANTQKASNQISTVPDLFSNTSSKHPDKNNHVDSSSLNKVEQKRYEVKNLERYVVKDQSAVFVTRKGNVVGKSALSNSLKDAPKLEQLKEKLVSHSLPSGADAEANNIHQNWTERTVQDFANHSSSTSQRNSQGSASGAEYLSQSLPIYNKSGILNESVAASVRMLSAQLPTDSAVNKSDEVTKRSVQHDASSSNLNSDGVTLQSTTQVKMSGSASPTPRVFFQNLFNRFSGKVSGNSSASSDSPIHSNLSSRASTPTVMDNVALSFRLSPDEFSSCDHRLKLFFEVSLFEGGNNETFCCLLKAPVVPYGSTVETPAVLITSNKMVYICRFTLRGSGTPDECLTKLVCHPLDELQYVDQGLSYQSFRLEFSTGKSCYNFYVRDKDRCERFLKLFIDSAQQAKARVGGAPVTVTPPNPQTVQHIRSWVFGVWDEDPVSMCQRIHQQAIHFTDPPLIKDRKSLLRSYSSCFVGKDFVSWMVRTGEVDSREEAVSIGQRFLNAGTLEHVSKEQHFEDKDQYYRFSAPERKLETSDYFGRDLEKELAEDSLPVLDTSIVLFIMAHRCTNTKRPHYNLSAVSVIISRTHIALASQNPRWPVPRYADPPVPPQEPPFVCLVKHKITDITSLDFYEDDPCFMGISFTDEDAPRETAESQWILRTATFTTLSSLVRAIRKPWESLFGVELQQNLHPTITEDKA